MADIILKLLFLSQIYFTNDVLFSSSVAFLKFLYRWPLKLSLIYLQYIKTSEFQTEFSIYYIIYCHSDVYLGLYVF